MKRIFLPLLLTTIFSVNAMEGPEKGFPAGPKTNNFVVYDKQRHPPTAWEYAVGGCVVTVIKNLVNGTYSELVAAPKDYGAGETILCNVNFNEVLYWMSKNIRGQLKQKILQEEAILYGIMPYPIKGSKQ